MKAFAAPILFPSALLLAACSLLSLLFWERPDFLISSDSLLPASLIWDALHHSYAWSGFQQARVPSFFPDMVTYGAFQTLSGSWRIATAAWVFMMTGWLIAIASWIAARMAGCSARNALLAVLAIMLPLLAAAALEPFNASDVPDKHGALLPYLFILLPFTHGGPFLLALTAAALADRLRERMEPLAIALLLLLSGAAGASDLLSVTVLQLPLTVALLAGLATGKTARQPALLALGCAWGGCAIGWACAQMASHQPTPYPSLASLPNHISAFLADFRRHRGMMLVATGLLLLMAMDVRRRGLRGWLGSFWSVFAATSAGAALLATMCLYQDVWSYRYALPFLWWPVILGAAALIRMSREKAAMLGLPVAASAAGLVVACSAPGWQAPRLFVWQSPLAECLERAGLHAGLAEYWSARKTSAASDWALQIDQITPSGAAYVWGNDRLWFTHDIDNAARRPPYRFIVMDRLKPTRIAATYGEPDRVMKCGASSVWVYAEPGQVYGDMIRVSSALN